jgi:hypothetical protein
MMVWIKRRQFWKEEELDPMFRTMISSMSEPPVRVNAADDTLQGGRVSLSRKNAGIEMSCSKTHGCLFVSKDKKALQDHEKSCRSKTTEIVCRIQGCKFTTTFKSAMTNHAKKCKGNGAASQPALVAAPEVVVTQVEIFVCAHRGCSMTYPTKKQSVAHQRTHTKPTPNPKPTNGARKSHLEFEKEGRSNEDTQSDDGKQQKVTNKSKQRESKGTLNAGKPVPATDAASVTQVFKCFFSGCDKSHATIELARRHQQKHREPSTTSVQVRCLEYRCLQCPESHATAEQARLHQQKHQVQPPIENEMITCPLCQVFRAPATLVVAHMPACQQALTCSECHMSFGTQILLIGHLQNHRAQQRSPLENEMLACPECQVYRGTAAQVFAHITACRQALTCPECNKKCDSQSLLLVHVIRCARGDAVTGRKRPREDDEDWKPTRIHNEKAAVRDHWQRSHVAKWLRLVELDEYGPKFEQEKVDGRILLELTDENLKSELFGMKATHAAKFLALRNAFV